MGSNLMWINNGIASTFEDSKWGLMTFNGGGIVQPYNHKMAALCWLSSTPTLNRSNGASRLASASRGQSRGAPGNFSPPWSITDYAVSQHVRINGWSFRYAFKCIYFPEVTHIEKKKSLKMLHLPNYILHYMVTNKSLMGGCAYNYSDESVLF